LISYPASDVEIFNPNSVVLKAYVSRIFWQKVSPYLSDSGGPFG